MMSLVMNRYLNMQHCFHRVAVRPSGVLVSRCVSLLIVLLTFGALAGERERGTLRQVLSLGVRPRDLVLGKALGLAPGDALTLPQ